MPRKGAFAALCTRPFQRDPGLYLPGLGCAWSPVRSAKMLVSPALTSLPVSGFAHPAPGLSPLGVSRTSHTQRQCVQAPAALSPCPGRLLSPWSRASSLEACLGSLPHTACGRLGRLRWPQCSTWAIAVLPAAPLGPCGPSEHSGHSDAVQHASDLCPCLHNLPVAPGSPGLP